VEERVCALFYSEQYITLHNTRAAADAKLQLQREKRRNTDGQRDRKRGAEGTGEREGERVDQY